MPKSTSARKKEPPARAPAKQPPDPPPPDVPPETSPVVAGPVTIQVTPEGFVTLSVNPPQPALLAAGEEDVVALEGFAARGFGEWLRGEPVTKGPSPAPAERGPVDVALDKLRAALQTIGEKVEEFASDVTTLEVRTYVSDRLDRLDDDFFTTTEPRALTRVDLDGDTDVVVPLDEGRLDETLWRIHSDTVAQAQAHREAMLRTVLELVRAIVPTIK
jgi:hypothetical protein